MKADKASVLKTLVGVSVVALVAASSALANPLDPTVVTANVGIIGVGTTNVTINNNTLRSIVNWGDFSIGVGDKTTINQIAPNAAILNRVIGNNVSQIFGQLNSNGQVYLINEPGIVVGALGVVDTNGFVASTLNVSNTDFIGNGNMLFKQTSKGLAALKFTAPSSRSPAAMCSCCRVKLKLAKLARSIRLVMSASGLAKSCC